MANYEVGSAGDVKILDWGKEFFPSENGLLLYKISDFLFFRGILQFCFCFPTSCTKHFAVVILFFFALLNTDE